MSGIHNHKELILLQISYQVENIHFHSIPPTLEQIKMRGSMMIGKSGHPTIALMKEMDWYQAQKIMWRVFMLSMHWSWIIRTPLDILLGIDWSFYNNAILNLKKIKFSFETNQFPIVSPLDSSEWERFWLKYSTHVRDASHREITTWGWKKTLASEGFNGEICPPPHDTTWYGIKELPIPTLESWGFNWDSSNTLYMPNDGIPKVK